MATDAVKIEEKPMIESVITVFALNNSPNVLASPPLNPNVDPAPTIDSKAGPGLAKETETAIINIIVVGHFHLKVIKFHFFSLLCLLRKI